MKWTLQSEYPLQDTLYYGFFWVQKYGSKRPYPVWRSNLPSHAGHVLTYGFDNEHHIPMEQIEVWYRPNLSALPEPYEAPKAPKDLIGTWVDGAEEEPKLTWHYLIQVKADALRKTARYSNLREVFIDAYSDTVWLPEDVWWLKLEDKEVEDDDE